MSYAAGCGYLAWSWHKRSREKSKLTGNEVRTAKLLQLQGPQQ